ncbi:MAG: hypothetical protein P8M73_12935 [Luminiphilus sp.]|jgi:hypothetical protein|nr:hypothetical protein [Luminiphilus sp.]
MKKLLAALLATAISMMAMPSVIAADINAQYNLCIVEVKNLYGDDTRVSLKKSKSRKGVTTLKLKVVPSDAGSMTVECSSQVDLPEAVVLLNNEGEPLAS